MLLAAPVCEEASTAKMPIAFWAIILHVRCPTLVTAMGVFMVFLKRISISRVRFRNNDHWGVNGAFFDHYRARLIMWRVIA